MAKKDIKLEGILVAIDEVYCERTKQQVVESDYCTVLIIEEQLKTKKRKREILFSGIVFPDSIGHRVTYEDYTGGEILRDHDLDRNYRTKQLHES